jgi:N-acetylglucosaminyl-diphospho-decaprenol L-rhamnosyltransferase
MVSPTNCVGVLISCAMPPASRPTASEPLAEAPLLLHRRALGRSARGGASQQHAGETGEHGEGADGHGTEHRPGWTPAPAILKRVTSRTAPRHSTLTNAAAWQDSVMDAVTVVIATRNRRPVLLRTLTRLAALPERPPIVVVDNGSDDGTADAVRREHPTVTLIEPGDGLGPAARTVGMRAASTPLVAFTDDDSWWEPGALARAAALFDGHPSLGLVAARILVEPGGVLDSTCEAMRDSPLADGVALPGPPVLGFVACGAVARRSAVLECGGFDARFGFGGEEEVLAIDLASAGWRLAYVDDVVAHHEPTRWPRPERRVRELRNQLWSAWLRWPLRDALRRTATIAADRDGGPRALLAALRGTLWVSAERRRIPPHVAAWLRAL